METPEVSDMSSSEDEADDEQSAPASSQMDDSPPIDGENTREETMPDPDVDATAHRLSNAKLEETPKSNIE
jgi:hypothetical protein